MLRTVSSISVLLFLTVIGAGQAKNDLQKANLAGPVRTVKQSSYRTMGSEVAKNPKMEPGDTVTYDRNGNEIERVIVSDFGESMGKETNKYDSAGLLQETSFTAPDGKVVETVKYTYEAGKVVQSLTSDGSGVLRAKTTRKFGPRGELTEETYFDPNTARAKTVFESDGGGKPVKLSFFMINGEKAIAPVGPCLGGHQVLYTYDADGRTASKSVLDTNGRVKKS